MWIVDALASLKLNAALVKALDEVWVVDALANLELTDDDARALDKFNVINKKLCMNAMNQICQGWSRFTAETISSRLLRHGMAAQKLHLVSTCPHPLN